MAIGQKYHISLNSDGKWKVRGESSEKTLKLFNTQKEAIAYAKTVAGNQEGNIVIHKTDGKIRKQDYSSKGKEEPKGKSKKPEEKKPSPKVDTKAKPSKTDSKDKSNKSSIKDNGKNKKK